MFLISSPQRRESLVRHRTMMSDAHVAISTILLVARYHLSSAPIGDIGIPRLGGRLQCRFLPQLERTAFVEVVDLALVSSNSSPHRR